MALGTRQPLSRHSMTAVGWVFSDIGGMLSSKWPATRVSKYVLFAPMTLRLSSKFSEVQFGTSQGEITRRIKYWPGRLTKSILRVGKATPPDEHSLPRTKRARPDLLIWRTMAMWT